MAAPPGVTEEPHTIAPTPFQRRVLLIPEEYDLFLGGGRGGGKSYSFIFMAIRHAEQHGQNGNGSPRLHPGGGLLDLLLTFRKRVPGVI